MYYNKYEQNKCQQGKQQCNKFDVAYYEVKKHDNCNKCKGEIEKTERLIDCIGNGAQDVFDNLQNATPQLANAVDAFNNLNLDGFVDSLNNIIRTLQNVVNAINNPTSSINVARDAVQATEGYVNNANTNQQQLINKINYLENQFENTICCLKKDEGGHPILIPVEKECTNRKPQRYNCDWDD